MSNLPTDAKARKAIPLCSGCFDYFPDALLAVAEVSRAGNDQHNPGQNLHWAKEKSRDEADALLRHLIDRGTKDSDGLRHSAKVAWRALALLQREIDIENGFQYDEVTNSWEKHISDQGGVDASWEKHISDQGGVDAVLKVLKENYEWLESIAGKDFLNNPEEYEN